MIELRLRGHPEDSERQEIHSTGQQSGQERHERALEIVGDVQLHSSRNLLPGCLTALRKSSEFISTSLHIS